MSTLVHYTYANSSAAYRTRIALNLKGVKAEEHYVHLLREGGQQHAAAYAQLNPQEIVPTLIDDGRPIGQSLAIIEYLEERFPAPPLLPKDPYERARVRQVALAVVADIHPLNNLRVRQYLAKELLLDETQASAWYRHWIDEGFEAIERLLSEEGPYAFGPTPTLADVVLVPQVANARRFNIPLAAYPRILRADAAARALKPFADAAPENQPDFGK
ncbi:MAG: maleylacetoacetate isomerase [Alphaproteobacteria bacterium]|nr:maleylacetoacetate isomerase [Alphaproteobacteria bacterium]